MYMDEDPDPRNANKYRVHQENGSVDRFLMSTLQTDANTLATLTNTAGITATGNFIFTHKRDQSSYYFYPITPTTAITSGLLFRIVDRNGYVTHLSYTTTGSLAGALDQVTDPAGRSLQFSYVISGTPGTTYLHGVSDPAGRTVGFDYDSSGYLHTYTDEAGQVWTFGYAMHNGAVLMNALTDPKGGTVTNTYDDSLDRLTSQQDALKRAYTFAYRALDSPADNLVTTETDPLNYTTVYTYYTDTLRVMTRNPGPGQEQWQYEYDDTPGPNVYHTGITATIDPLGHEWTQTWDANGNLLSRTDPLGHTTKYAYDDANNLVVMTNALQMPITYTSIRRSPATYDASRDRSPARRTSPPPSTPIAASSRETSSAPPTRSAITGAPTTTRPLAMCSPAQIRWGRRPTMRTTQSGGRSAWSARSATRAPTPTMPTMP